LKLKIEAKKVADYKNSLKGGSKALEKWIDLLGIRLRENRRIEKKQKVKQFSPQ
jgi:hypothetical protein